MKILMYTMRVGKSNNLLPFTVMSIESLYGVYRDFTKHYQWKYILTSRLNQDCLENFFSRIRRIGGFYDHPQATEVRNRIRLLILLSEKVNSIISTRASVAPKGNNCNEHQDQDLLIMTSQLFISIEDNDNNSAKSGDSSRETGKSPEEIIIDDSPIVFESDDQNQVCIPTVVNCGREALKYIAGYVAFRCLKYDSTLGSPTGHLGLKDGEQPD